VAHAALIQRIGRVKPLFLLEVEGRKSADNLAHFVHAASQENRRSVLEVYKQDTEDVEVVLLGVQVRPNLKVALFEHIRVDGDRNVT